MFHKHRCDQGRATTCFTLCIFRRYTLALHDVVVIICKHFIVRVLFLINNRDIHTIFKTQTQFFNVGFNDSWTAYQNRNCQTVIYRDLNCAKYTQVFTFCISNTFRIRFSLFKDWFHHECRVVDKLRQTLTIMREICDWTCCHARIHCCLCNSRCNL